MLELCERFDKWTFAWIFNQDEFLWGCDHLPHAQDLFGDDDDGDNTTVMVTKVFCPGMENSLSDVRKIQKRTGKAFLSSMII